MATSCRFSSCQWAGDIDNLFDHCETYHSNYIKEINEDNGFSFAFDDMVKGTFLLIGTSGLYWFLRDPTEDETGIRRGIFAIGESEVCNFTAKIGRINDGYVTYFGPFQTLPDTSNEYEFALSYFHMEFLNEKIVHKRLEVYFGDYEDKEEYTGTHHDVDWEDPEELKYNAWCMEKFTCFVCLEFIKSNARFCENRHFLCSPCLTKLMEQKKVKCPMCRGEFPYDCIDQNVEDVLRCVRFADYHDDPDMQ